MIFFKRRVDWLPHANSAADEHLLGLIRNRDQDGWAQFVARFQGRMVAFARAQTDRPSDAEDLVQEALIGFLRSLDAYRGDSNLESWLFRILRRRIIDHYRVGGAAKEITACLLATESPESQADPMASFSDSGESPSVHARQQESSHEDERLLSQALGEVIDRLKADSNLRDLMIMEGLFYAGIRNRDLARLIEVDPGQIALVRHRLLNRLRKRVDEGGRQADTAEHSPPSADLLTRIWERDRPSCPKRTTLGKSLVGILDPPWQDYIHFHVDLLGCRYCTANREDLDDVAGEQGDRAARIFQSTIGFVSRPD